MTSSGYLRYPHIHGDLLVFVSEDDVWLAPADGGRAWRLSADSAQVSYPRFSRDGARIAWTSWRDGNPEVYTADPDGDDAGRSTYWSDARTRVTGWTQHGEVLAVSATGQPETYLTWAYAVPLEGAPRRLPFGPVTDLALEETGTALLTGRMNTEPAFWKRYRGGTRGKLWTATGTDPLFTRVLGGLDGQLAGPMLIGGRLFFLSDHEGTGNIYSCALDGSDLSAVIPIMTACTRGTRPRTGSGSSITWRAISGSWTRPEAAEPRKLEVTLGSPAAARAPRLVCAEDHLGGLDCDQTGQASVVEVRGTVHWLTHQDGPARALHVDPAARARLPRVLGETGQAVWVTDATGADALEIGSVTGEPGIETVRLAAGQLGNVVGLTASPDGAAVAAAAHDGRLLVVDVASGQVTELAASDDGVIGGLSWSPDSAWLAWAQPGPRPLGRIRLARVAGPRGLGGSGFVPPGQHEIIDVTDGRFADSDPVFTSDGLYLAFISRRSFDPVYDEQTFDMSFPLGSRPYLVPLAAQTPSPFGPLPGGRPLGQDPPAPDKDKDKDDDPERTEVSVDADGISGRVVGVPVVEARYSALRAVKGGLAWLREPVTGVLGEGAASPEDERRGRFWSGSTCASAKSPSWSASSTGSTSAATAPGWWSRITTSCGSCRPSTRRTTARPSRSPSTCPGPGSRPTRSRCGSTPSPRRAG